MLQRRLSHFHSLCCSFSAGMSTSNVMRLSHLLFHNKSAHCSRECENDTERERKWDIHVCNWLKLLHICFSAAIGSPP